MRIVCPQCGYSRDIPTDKVPSRSSIATCPKCQFRFRFRGHQAPSRPDEALDEPVYPPRPSRPAVPVEDATGYQPHTPYEPRSQRLYMPEPAPEAGPRPEAEPEHYGHMPPRPQARWLPDPEPGQEPQAPAGARQPWVSRQPLEEEGPGVDVFGRLGESLAPRPSEAETAAPPVIERTAPVSHASPVQPEELASHGASRLGEPVEPGYAMPGPAPSEDVQPSEAVAGEDSVRDIWARLQAMGGETKAAPSVPRQAEGEPAAPSASVHPDTVAPWEQLEHYGVVPAFLNTVKNILARPGDFFEQLPPVSGKLRPLIFALVVSVLAMLAGVVWNYFGLGPNLSELGRTDGFQGLGSGAIGGLALLGLSPIALIAFVFLDSALTHLLLGLLRSAARPFEDTFRIICYAGAPWVLAALPVPYSYLIPVVLIWHMTLQAIGLKKLHQAGYPQVLASVLVKWSLFFMASFAFLHVLITRR
ncbi:YIP1 family protein [Fundidesulfovibrio terrae]|uniref:YIP1 family protein n=1 Tax=Fundidesulfovibrio terrae TaxID=2922866 RepID=UPI001FAF747C|nr:YIP1 family protein [Fundidesulfovibrio terrae]